MSTSLELKCMLITWTPIFFPLDKASIQVLSYKLYVEKIRVEIFIIIIHKHIWHLK
jgi:hypothetical protein